MNRGDFAREVTRAIGTARSDGNPPVAVVLLASPYGASEMAVIQESYLQGVYWLHDNVGRFLAQGSLDTLFNFCDAVGILYIQ